MTWVFVIGGLLELLGLLLVGWDVLDSYLGLTRYVPQTVKERFDGKMWNRYIEAEANERVAAEARAAAAGNIKRRALGVLVFAVGVIVQTAGNIASL
jgi:hypothetical protein